MDIHTCDCVIFGHTVDGLYPVEMRVDVAAKHG